MSTNGNGTGNTPRRDEDVPPDLRELRDRMAELGVDIRLPIRPSGFKLPKPVRVKGEPLSETVIRIRRGELPRPEFPEDEVSRPGFVPVSARQEFLRRLKP
jgi:hypothetical protein